MAIPRLFKPADYGWQADDLVDAQGRPTFKSATIEWSAPKLWNKDDDAPTGSHQKGCLYLLTREHHRASRRERIAYVGIASDLGSRFTNHPKAAAIAATRGDVYLSVGTVNFGTFRTAQSKPKPFLEQIEHLLIWALWTDCMLNEKKAYMLPGQGKNRGHAWHIRNVGHRFAGQMPIEIIHPWMLVKSGRNRARKQSAC